ncbi:thiamine pyrophosphate-binding protein [Haloarchaeobius salinus]|uniref:thiamine pyrophosphate-binding protein n=1 Tax=Haloarchaeobius salinus TaxID=1198298 RepID=UPI00210D677D|nr:thiamine pyrophosphate-binding protein [Haloarchaeobius salinus]
MTDVIERLVSDLEKMGIEYAFGFPGGRVIEFIEELSSSEITFVRARDEREASFMAEAYGRIHGKPAVLTGQGPWIGSTGAQGAMEAHFGSSPLLIITDASERGDYAPLSPYQQSRGDYGGMSLPKIFDSFTKEWWYANSGADAIRCTQLAYKHATAGRPGPTAVILDGSAVGADLPEDSIPQLWDPASQTRNWRSRPLKSDLDAAVSALETADRPVIIAGNGVHASGAHEELAAVAEAYDCAVTTSFLGKSTIAETHDLAGGVIGAFGQEGANQLVSDADVLLVVGCRLNPNDVNWGAPSFIRPEEQTIIHADIDSRNAGWVYPADVGLIGDAAESLRELVALGERTDDDASERATEAKASFEPNIDNVDELVPTTAVKAIESVVDEDTYVCSDAGNNRMWLFNYFKSKSPRTFFGPGGLGVMGWSAPAAVALALTTENDVVSVSGDGGFAMTMTAVETAVELDVAPTFLVLNDAALGSVRDFETQRGSIHGVRFNRIEYAETVKSFGANGVSITEPSELEPALEDAMASDVATVLDVRIEGEHDVFGDDGLQSSFYRSMSGGLHE